MTFAQQQQRTIALPGWGYKLALVVHIVSAVSWIGVDLVLLLLAVNGLVSDNAATVAAAYRAMGMFTLQLLIPAGLLSLASGIVLGLGTRYGLIRYWWVVIKLVINVVLTVLVMVLLRGSIGDASAAGRDFTPRDELGRLPMNLVFPPAVSIAALTFATVLSVFKPWGRLPHLRR